jgi:uncharacterized membrane protein YccC
MAAPEMRLTEHPRARAGIRRAKGGAGLGVFVIVLLLSLRAGLTPDAALGRALPAGVAAYIFAWGAAVTIWRQIALAELEAVRARHEARREQALRELAADA